MTVNADDPRTPRVQIADTLRAEITSGALAAGKRLPSVIKLSERFGVSTSTVQAALDLLRQEGLIYSAGPRGSFVRDDIEAGANDAAGEELSVGEVLNEIRATLDQLETRVAALESEQRP